MLESPEKLESNENLEKIVVILGPTASGKSSTAIKLAQALDGEIISADSRQIYRGMDIGSGKITPQEQSTVPHWMLDIISPRSNFSAAQFKKRVDKIITGIIKRGKLPIICGGTGFWIQSIVDDIDYPSVKPDWELRNQLRNSTCEELLSDLKKLDPRRAETIDQKNPVRLIRAIEICKSLGQVPSAKYQIPNTKYQFLQIGIQRDKEILHQRIRKNIENRMNQGMIAEVENLKSLGLSWKKIESFGLGYKLIPQYLRGEIATQEELLEKIYLAEKNYAKRQMTWFAKDKRILWIKNYNDIEKAVATFLKK